MTPFVLHLDMIQTLALAAVVLFIGYGIRRRVAVLDRYNIPAPVVGGFLFAAVSLGLRLGGVMALSTYLPLVDTVAAEAAPANKDVPILMCHGTADPVLPLQMGEVSRDRLLAAGYPVEWKAYRMQHQVSLAEIADISTWLGRQLPPGRS